MLRSKKTKKKRGEKRKREAQTDLKPARRTLRRAVRRPPAAVELGEGTSEKAKGLLMNRLFIDLMDTTAFNYVRGGLLIEAAKQGPCLLSDCVARNDERVIDSRATGLKDEAPSLSHRSLLLPLSLSPRAGFSFCVVFLARPVSGRLHNPLSFAG